MTGGQVSPTTPMGDFATTAPYGGMENTFDIAGLTIAAGASFVARSTVYHAKALERMIEKAMRKTGFSLVEIMSPCPTAYGKINKKGLPKDLILNQKTQAVNVEKAKSMSPDDLRGRIITGILADRELPEYISTYDKIMSSAQRR
jgi:2-oxoglutarate ferredoxin oxidoreductase subunit beta